VGHIPVDFCEFKGFVTVLSPTEAATATDVASELLMDRLVVDLLRITPSCRTKSSNTTLCRA